MDEHQKSWWSVKVSRYPYFYLVLVALNMSGLRKKLTAHFAEKCNLHDNHLTTESIPPFQSPFSSSNTTVHFRESTLRRKLQRVDASKASGPDGISCRVLKECVNELALPLSTLFSCYLRVGQLLTACNRAKVISIHKRESKSKPNS